MNNGFRSAALMKVFCRKTDIRSKLDSLLQVMPENLTTTLSINVEVALTRAVEKMMEKRCDDNRLPVVGITSIVDIYVSSGDNNSVIY